MSDHRIAAIDWRGPDEARVCMFDWSEHYGGGPGYYIRSMTRAEVIESIRQHGDYMDQEIFNDIVAHLLLE